MQAIAKARFVRTSPRKARLVIDAIRGKEVREALAILKFTPNKAARLIEKVVASAAANAENNFHMNGDSLKVAVAMVDGGPVMKRLRYAPQGRGYRMVKRTSHITIAVEEVEGLAAKKARKKPVANVAAPKAGKVTKAAAEKPATKAKAKAAPAAKAPAEEKKPRTRAKAAKPVVAEETKPEAVAEVQPEQAAAPEAAPETQPEQSAEAKAQEETTGGE